MESDDSTFGYRGHIGWGQWIGLAYFGLLALGATALTLSSWLLHGEFSTVGFLGSVLLIAFTGLLFALYRALATSEVALRETGLDHANYQAEGFIPYDELEDVRGRYIPYVGGWLTLVGPDHTLRMTVVLDDIDEFTRQLHEHLRSLENPPYDRENLFGFYKTATYSNLSWDHLYDSWPVLLGGTVVGFGLTAATFALIGSSTIDVVLGGIMLGVCVPWILFPLFDVALLARRIAHEADISEFSVPQISAEERAEYLHTVGLWTLGLVAAADLSLLVIYGL